MLIIKKIICIVLTGMLLILSGCGVVKSPQPVSEATATIESEVSAIEPNATVLDGFTTNFANVEDVSDDVAEWISGLEIVNQL